MNTVTIEQVALRNAIGRFDDDDEILDVSVQSFMDGVKWGRNEVWNDVQVEPSLPKDIMFLSINSKISIARHEYIREWRDFTEINCFVKWAYIEDLLSYGKEDNK